MEAECAADAAASSVLAEFHQELLRRYDLLFVDPSYGSGDPSIERTKSHLIRYAAGNLQGDALSVISGSRTMTAVKCESAELSGVRCIFDEKAKPLKEQILAYMTAEPLGEAAAGITQKVDAWKGIGPDASEWHRKKEENEKTLQEELSRRREEEPEEPDRFHIRYFQRANGGFLPVTQRDSSGKRRRNVKFSSLSAGGHCFA